MPWELLCTRFRSALIFRDIDGRQLRHIHPGTGLEDVRQSDPQNDGDGGDHLEVDNGFRTNTPELFGITNTRDTHHQCGDHNRHNNHFDQMDEDITRRRAN